MWDARADGKMAARAASLSRRSQLIRVLSGQHPRPREGPRDTADTTNSHESPPATSSTTMTAATVRGSLSAGRGASGAAAARPACSKRGILGGNPACHAGCIRRPAVAPRLHLRGAQRTTSPHPHPRHRRFAAFSGIGVATTVPSPTMPRGARKPEPRAATQRRPRRRTIHGWAGRPQVMRAVPDNNRMKLTAGRWQDGRPAAAYPGVLRTERSGDLDAKVMRRVLGHVVGVLCSLVTIGQAPRLMDGAVCALANLGVIVAQTECTIGSAGLGEGGLSLGWNMGPPLLGLALIMETALWLQRLYSAPSWLPPVVALLGCPALLGLITRINEGLPGFGWETGIVMGLPVALAFTAYWIPLRLSQGRATRGSGEPQNNQMQLTARAQAMGRRS